MPLLSRKFLMLAVLLLSFSLRPIAFAQSNLAGLQGQYAFQLNGTLTVPGIASRATAAIGSFTADGQGNITAGEMDFTSAAETFQALPISGTYTLDDSGTGTLILTSNKGSESFAFYATGSGSYPPVFASGSLVESDVGPVVSSGTFYQQNRLFFFSDNSLYGFWQTTLNGETFVSKGTPSPIFAGGSVYLNIGENSFFTLTSRVGAGAPISIVETLLSGAEIDNNGRILFTAYDHPFHMAAYVIDTQHILVISTDPPQVNPLISGTLVRDLSPNL